MMMNTTLAQLRTLKLDGLASGLEEQLTLPAMAGMSFEERLALLVDRSDADGLDLVVEIDEESRLVWRQEPRARAEIAGE